MIAVSATPVGPTRYLWHRFPDGGATFPAADGGWVYVSNSEVPFVGGASAIRFARDGTILDAYRILGGTNRNCAGGATPWGTWLSCEETPNGVVWECDPLGKRSDLPAARPALGHFAHEAAAVDPDAGHVYLTEDQPDGRLYRFTPDTYPVLDAGRLEVAKVAPDGTVTWLPVPNAAPLLLERPTRHQVADSTAFAGGEGAWFADGVLYVATSGDNRVWAYDTGPSTIRVLYEPTSTSPLRGVDNVTGAPNGTLVVAEDGDDMQLVLLLPDGAASPLLQVVGHSGSEVTGPAFDPSTERLYFSSQRGGPAGPGLGITYEVRGPFHRVR